MEDRKFVDTVKEEMAEFGNRGVTEKGEQFAVWFGVKILREDEGETIEQYHIGGTGDNKLDIGVLDDEHSAVIISQCKFSQSPLSTTFDTDLPEEAKNAQDRLKTIPDAGNEKRKRFAHRFKHTDKPVRILAVGFGKFSPAAYNYAKIQKIEVYDFEKIKRRYIYNEVMEQCREPDSAKFEIERKNNIVQEIPSMGLKQWVFLLNVRDIYELVKEYRDGVFQMDLRFRLEKSAKSGIGKEIYDTILSDEAPAFSLLNNGLTLIAKKVEIENNQITLITPQIVNGCQTSWAIYDAMEQLKNGGENISQVKTNVLVKLIETTEDRFILRITQTTNKQNPITGRDLHGKDDFQPEIALAFKRHDPPIFYDYREGLWESVVREDQQSLYRVRGKRHRRLNNTLAGQFYLALLDRPYWSKQFKQKIFEDSDYYRVIFHYDLDPSERFLNETLDLKPNQVNLKSGANNFVEDVLFAYGIYQLADALKVLYRKKIKRYPPNPRNREETAFKLLVGQEFLTHWHFLLIGLMHHIIVNWVKRGESEKKLRSKLIGEDWNLIFGPILVDEFNLDTNLEIAPILNEDNPSDTFKLFSRWIEVLIEQICQKVGDRRDEPGFTFRRFIDQRADTFLELQQWINTEYARGKRHWEEKFPKDI